MAIAVRKPRMVDLARDDLERPYDERNTTEHELQAMIVFDGEFAEAVAALNAAEADYDTMLADQQAGPREANELFIIANE